MLWLVPGTACNVLCSGPGCEDFYPTARVSLLAGEPSIPPLDVWEDGEGRYDGTDLEGSGWVTAPAPGALPDGQSGIFIGQPEFESNGVAVGRVVLVAAPTSEGPVVPVAQWVNDEGGASQFGASVYARIADDGGFDLWIGAPGHDYGRGAVYLFRDAHLGGATTGDEDLLLVSASPNDRFGEQIVPCADLTDPPDGIPELAITAPWFAEPADWPVPVPEGGIQNLAGAVFLVRSDQLGGNLADLAPWDVGRVWWGDEAGEGAGTAVVCDRDLDNDGRFEVVIGSPWAGRGRGRISIVSADVLPSSGPLSEARGSVIEGTEGTQDWFGISLATINGESADRATLAVGVAGYNDGAGAVNLYNGRVLLGPNPIRFGSFESDPKRQAPDHFGRWLYRGDLDGDTLLDLIVGAPDYKGEARNAFDTGHLWAFYGVNRDRWEIGTTVAEAGLEIGGTEPFQRVGAMVTLSDADGDATDELWVPTRNVATER